MATLERKRLTLEIKGVGLCFGLASSPAPSYHEEPFDLNRRAAGEEPPSSLDPFSLLAPEMEEEDGVALFAGLPAGSP